MSQENVEIVQRMYEAFHRRDADGALALYAFWTDCDFSAIAGPLGSRFDSG